MRVPRLRLSVRWMMVAVALAALNLAAAMHTARFYPRPRRPSAQTTEISGRSRVTFGEDGSVEYAEGNLEDGFRPSVLYRPLAPPTLLQTWAPVIASAALTLVMLLLPGWRSCSRRTAGGPPTGTDSPWQGARASFLTRTLLIAAALVALNVAACVYRPPDVPELDPTGIPRGGWEGTIVSQADGSVVAYPGRPGVLGRGERIRPPTRSLLAQWLPLVAAAGFSLWVLTNRPAARAEAAAPRLFREFRNRRGPR